MTKVNNTTTKFIDLSKQTIMTLQELIRLHKEVIANAKVKKPAKVTPKLTGKVLNVANKRLRGTLPKLKDNYEVVDCSNNNLTSLPTLPRTLVKLNCRLNVLTSLPELPLSLVELICDDNPFTGKEKKRIRALCKSRSIKLKI